MCHCVFFFVKQKTAYEIRISDCSSDVCSSDLGRYRSALVEPGNWILPALIWLESLPVELGHVDLAQTWPWSSAAGHIGMDVHRNDWLTDHPDYWQGGNTPFARQAAHRALLGHGLGSAQSQRIEQAVFGQWALGGSAFLASAEERRVGERG